MKKTHFCQKALVVALGSLYISIAQAQSYLPHVTLEGVTGSQTYGRLDALAPIVPGCNSLFYTDLQAKYGYDDAYYVGLGLGDRVISGDKILGGYLFLDYNESQHHHDYWILSPGVELLKACWDVRLNGYIPINGRQRNEGSFFPSGPNECGIHGDCSFVEFAGHQQFEHRFMRIEEVGPGADLVFGKKWGCNNLFQIGPYYYHMSDSNDIIGGVARVELPLRAGVSLVGEASYDNDHHGAAVMGLQYRFNNPQSCAPLCDRLYDQVYRYRGNLNTGTGIRVKHDNKDEGLFLRRDDIFFFSPTGTAVIADPNAGTFENPLASTQFTQATVNAIGRDANLYFSTGTYSINAPVGILTLVTGQSLYGRSSDFKCTVNGDERPLLLGGIDLNNSTDHTFDSIQLRNIQINPTARVVALSANFVRRLNICNSDFLAEADFIGDAPASNFNAAIGIGGTVVNNDVDGQINHSRINALATVSGNNSGFNSAVAIGDINGLVVRDFRFVIRDSELNATAQVGLNNLGLAGIGSVAANMASGIGLNIVNFGLGNFINNEFTLIDVAINAIAQVGNDNIGSGGPAFNAASGIGNNIISNIPATSSAAFNDNKFSLTCTEISSNAIVGRDNSATDRAFNFASGIGNNVISLAGQGILGGFSNNTFLLDNILIQSNALIGRDNINLTDDIGIALNMATGIGDNGASSDVIFSSAATFFVNNAFTICNSEIETTAQVGRDNINPITSASGGVFNIASGIGNNAVAVGGSVTGDASFIGNDFFINCCEIMATSVIGNNNFSSSIGESMAVNAASGIGNNLSGNLGSLFGGDFSNDNRIRITDTQVLASALVNNNNSALTTSNIASNLSVGIGVNLSAGFAFLSGINSQNEFTITNSQILGFSRVGNDNLATGELAGAFNDAAGIGGNVAAVPSTTITQLFFRSNDLTLTSTQVNGVAEIGHDNIVPAGAGVGVFNLATGLGLNNSSVAIVVDSTIGTNFNDNLVTLCDTSVSAKALIANDNSATGTLVGAFNQALGFGINLAFAGVSSAINDFSNTLADIECSSISAKALVGGSQNINAINSATGVTITGSGSTVSIFDSFIDVLARVDGSNGGTNLALGLSANGLNEIIQIFDSIVNVTALADGTNNAIATDGQVIATNTTFNVVEN